MCLYYVCSSDRDGRKGTQPSKCIHYCCRFQNNLNLSVENCIFLMEYCGCCHELHASTVPPGLLPTPSSISLHDTSVYISESTVFLIKPRQGEARHAGQRALLNISTVCVWASSAS